MIKKYISVTILLLTIGLFFKPGDVMAQYGQYGQTLGTTTPEIVIVHETKNAGIEDYLNPKFFSILSFSLSGTMLGLSKRKQITLLFK